MKKICPVVIGLKPPNKAIIIRKDGKGFDVFICWADFPEGTRRGDFRGEADIRGIASWMKFADAEAMKMFAETLMEAAEKEGER